MQSFKACYQNPSYTTSFASLFPLENLNYNCASKQQRNFRQEVQMNFALLQRYLLLRTKLLFIIVSN